MKKPKYKFYFQTFRYKQYFEFDLVPKIIIRRLSWKDKFETPRVESTPSFEVNWLGCQFMWETGSDQDWEKYLWATKYSKTGDLQDWPWKDIKNRTI